VGDQRLPKSRGKAAPGKSDAPESPAHVPAGPAAPVWLAAPAPAPFALGGVQRKVAIGASNDAYEREADHVASRVGGGGRVAPGSISSISPPAPAPVSQRQPDTKKNEGDKKNENNSAVQREVKPEDKTKDSRASMPLQKADKPSEKKDKKPESAPVQRQAKPDGKTPDDKKTETKPAPPPVQRADKPPTKDEDKKAEPPTTVVHRAKKDDAKKPDEKPSVQRSVRPEDQKKIERDSTAPLQMKDKPNDDKAKKPEVQRESKPADKEKDEKPTAPVQRESKPPDKKEEKPPSTPVQREAKPDAKGTSEEKQKPPATPVQRKEETSDTPKDEGAVQASRGGAAAPPAPSMESVASNAISSKGPGEPLNSHTRSALESGLGSDLSDVRVHSDSAAHNAADALNARAFTHQNDIWMGRGESQSDTRLMAHEATHVLQQTGSVHRQLVQRAEKGASTPSNDTPDGSAPVGEVKTGLLDPKAKTLTFEQVPVPAFKDKDHRKALYSAREKLIRKKDYKRGEPNQRDKWKQKIDTTEIEKKLQDKAKPVKAGMPPAPTEQYVFKVPTRSGGKPFMIGSIKDIATQLTTPYWGGKSKTPDAKTFDVDHIVELQLANWDTDKSANELANMELLDSSANRASGSMIADAIDKKIDGFLKTTKAPVPKAGEAQDPKKALTGREVIKRDYDIVFNHSAGAGGPSVGPADFWTPDQIQKGDHLVPVEASTLDEIGGKGTVLVFSNAAGGLGKTFLWTEKDKGPRGPANDAERDWPKPFNVQDKTFETSGEGVENKETLGTVTLYIPESNPKWKAYPPTPFPIKRIPGAKYAGHLNRADVRAKTGKLEKKGASPIQIDEFDIVPEGIFVGGRILPDIPLIKDAGIEFELRGDNLKIFKTFKTGDFTAPKPLSITDSSLTIFASTEKGLGVEGQVNFGIEKVGAGYLKGSGSTKGGFELAGSFDFDSQLFDPANVHVEYKDGKFSGGGKIGIKPGKVRGIKTASIEATFGEGAIDAVGSIQPDIPGVEQADLSMHYDEKSGLTIAGDLQLKKDIPGIADGSIHAEVNKKEDKYIVKAHGEATPKIPGISSKLIVNYDDGAFDATITAGYEKGMLKGSVTVGATNRPVGDDGKPGEVPAGKADKITVYGGGSVTIQLAPWLQATAAIRFLPNGEVEVTGKIGLPKVLDIFDEKKVEKNVFKIGIDIPLFPGIQLNVGGGLDLNAGIGPGQLQEVEVDVTYNPAHEDDTNVHGHAALHIPAHAGLRLNVHAALGVGIPLAKVEGGIELGGSLGVEGALHAAVDIDWTPKKGLVLDASAEIYAEPKLKFDVTGYVDVVVGVGWLSKTLWEKRWELAAIEYGSGLRFGLKLPVHYEEGKPFNVSLSDIQFMVPDIDPKAVLKGLMDKII